MFHRHWSFACIITCVLLFLPKIGLWTELRQFVVKLWWRDFDPFSLVLELFIWECERFSL